MSAAEIAALGSGGFGAVVVGAASDFTYRQLCVATAAIADGALFVATNGDAADALPGGRRLPGAGALVRYVETVVGRKADALVGKPSPFMCRLVREALGGVGAGRVACVGDRIDTDVAMGVALGCGATVLVLTGVTSEEEGGGGGGDSDSDSRGSDGDGVPPVWVADSFARAVGVPAEADG